MHIDFAHAIESSNDMQDAVVGWLVSRGFEVVDLRNDMAAQRDGIDLKVRRGSSWGGEWRTGEVKRDGKMARTGNFALEVVSNLSKGTPGCWVSSKADFWFYVDGVAKVLHIFRPSEVRSVVSATDVPVWKCSIASTRANGGGSLYRTISLLVPIDVVSSTESYRKFQLYEDLPNT